MLDFLPKICYNSGIKRERRIQDEKVSTHTADFADYLLNNPHFEAHFMSFKPRESGDASCIAFIIP